MDKLANGLKKEKCTACRACEQICPKKCIKMIEDEEGFFYPIKDKEECTECGLCKKVCPIYCNDIKEKIVKNRKVFALRYKKEEVLLESSSGGAFSAIMDAYCKEDYVIFGVKYDENLKIIHDYVVNKNDADIFKKSKYVQSNVGNSYKKVKEFLEKEKNVLFTGTPCQIAGLKQYLGKEYEKLLLVGLICHGVASQKTFDKYIQDTEKKHNKKIKNINFREKVKNKQEWNSRNIKLKFKDESIIIEDAIKNPYLRGYHNALFYRPSCENCLFANPNRLSDITIADCWGIQRKYPDIDVHKGESMIVINTTKGEKLLEEIKNNSYLKELDIEFAIENNAQFREPCKFNKNRKEFFDNFNSENFYKLVNRCIKINKLKLFISRHMPIKLKKELKKIIYKKTL